MGFALPSSRIALAAGLLAALAMAPSPLLGVHGVESALVLGIVLPPFVAAAAARQVIRARRLRVALRASRLLWGAIGMGLGVLAVAAGVLALNALRVRNCAPGQGLLMVLLGPTPGVVLAAVLGVAFGAAVRRPGAATALATLAPITGLGLGLFRFYDTPAISLFGHFFGWFPGAIYDAALDIPVELVTFRGVTTLLVGGVALAVGALWNPGTHRLRLAHANWPALVTAAALLACTATATAYGSALGHRSSVEQINEELGAVQPGRRCVVHAPREMRHEELLRHVRDCDFRVSHAERALGVRQREPVRVFLFRDADEKRRLMGAGGTHVAKPWRNEAYLNVRSWPHPVLAHEVAHVVAGRAAPPPWRVAGRLLGWVPNPGLIEGVAVAVAWEPRDGLTPHQWARAMVELDRMPSLDGIVGLGFLLQQGALAYTVAGSFLKYLLQTHGPDAVREAYRTADVQGALGRPLRVLEREWRAHLEHVPLPDEALALARMRFERGSIFTTVCPRRVALLRQRMGEDRVAGDPKRLVRTCSDILDIDPTDSQARAELVGGLARIGRVEEARTQLAILDGRYHGPLPVVAQARVRLADAAWLRGDVRGARAIYRALLDEPHTEDAARSLEVKSLALEADPAQARLVFALLVGDGGRGVPPAVAVHLARELDELRDDGLGDYLQGRQLFLQDAFPEAARLLDWALTQGLPTSRLQNEAAVLLGTSLYGAGRFDRAEALWRTRLAEADTPARRAEARDWLRRLAYARNGDGRSARLR